MRHDDRRRLLGLTWIGWTNLLFLQWFGMRIAAVVEPPDDTHVRLTATPWWPLAGWRSEYKALSVAWLALVVVGARFAV